MRQFIFKLIDAVIVRVALVTIGLLFTVVAVVMPDRAMLGMLTASKAYFYGK